MAAESLTTFSNK